MRIMRKKKAVNLSLQPGIIDWANKIMAEKRFASLSVLVEELIRERYELVFGVDKQESKHPAPITSSNLRYPALKTQSNEARETPVSAVPPLAKKKRAA